MSSMHNFSKEKYSMETKDIWIQRFIEWEEYTILTIKNG